MRSLRTRSPPFERVPVRDAVCVLGAQRRDTVVVAPWALLVIRRVQWPLHSMDHCCDLGVIRLSASLLSCGLADDADDNNDADHTI